MAKIIFSFVSGILIVLHLGLNSVEATPVDGEMLFDPDDIVEYEMPDSCLKEGMNYCFDKGDKYPDDKIEELLKDLPELKVENSKPPTDFGSRQGDSYDEPDCASESTNRPIYYIIDTNDKIRVVVQSVKKFQQIYGVKWCLNEGRITNDTPHFLKNTTLDKFIIECVSTKMNFEFFVLSDDIDGKLEVATAKGGIPVCCRCRYNATKVEDN